MSKTEVHVKSDDEKQLYVYNLDDVTFLISEQPIKSAQVTYKRNGDT